MLMGQNAILATRRTLGVSKQSCHATSRSTHPPLRQVCPKPPPPPPPPPSPSRFKFPSESSCSHPVLSLLPTPADSPHLTRIPACRSIAAASRDFGAPDAATTSRCAAPRASLPPRVWGGALLAGAVTVGDLGVTPASAAAVSPVPVRGAMAT